MVNKLAYALILVGILFGGWNGYVWATESSSGQEQLEENDIAPSEVISTTEKADSMQGERLPDEKSSDQKDDPSSSSLSRAEETEEETAPREDYDYEKGDDVGWLLIPSLDMKYPVYWGTDDETLTQGVGYHEGDFTTPPDGLGHTVLSGHRDTVFRELGDVEEGAAIFVQFEGVQYEYELEKTWITDADDRTVIVDKEEPTLTLTTCYPFNFIGAAPDRYIMEASLVDTVDME
ncbi:class D sortase [Alkalicoccus halolimnae]|uniref:Class D sortase n=1 Tax=Alkalicoccus halolimnae TaxID=1667239 RepID=A0A5C7F2A2_9BACI|nr:class D sortase [Alkalicoccus halolimnae]TXF81090.1 class D sortase [Alkalicoccus halolimnae]